MERHPHHASERWKKDAIQLVTKDYRRVGLSQHQRHLKDKLAKHLDIQKEISEEAARRKKVIQERAILLVEEIDKTMSSDVMEEEKFQGRKRDLRENQIPWVIVQGANWNRVAQIGEAQSIGGECYIWKTPRRMDNATINDKMRNIGGPVVFAKDTKIGTHNNRTEED